MQEDSPGAAIGRTLRTVREQHLFSREALAERSGVAAITIAQIELGKVGHPRRATIEKLARALSVTADAIISGEAAAPLGMAQLEVPHMRLPRAEFEELRREAFADRDGAGVRLYGELTREYNAVAAARDRVVAAGAPEEAIAEADELYVEAKMRWTVVLYEQVSQIVARDERRSEHAPEPPDITGLPLEEAYALARGRVGALAGGH
jgi:transcriptional regulator with XRE-family HTH domain